MSYFHSYTDDSRHDVTALGFYWLTLSHACVDHKYVGPAAFKSWAPDRPRETNPGSWRGKKEAILMTVRPAKHVVRLDLPAPRSP